MPTNVENVSYAKLGLHWQKMPWEIWRRNCNCLVIYWTGRGMFALSKSMPWQEWFEAGLCVCVAVHEALYKCGIKTDELLDDFESARDRYAHHETNRLRPTWRGMLDADPRIHGQ